MMEPKIARGSRRLGSRVSLASGATDSNPLSARIENTMPYRIPWMPWSELEMSKGAVQW